MARRSSRIHNQLHNFQQNRLGAWCQTLAYPGKMTILAGRARSCALARPEKSKPNSSSIGESSGRTAKGCARRQFLLHISQVKPGLVLLQAQRITCSRYGTSSLLRIVAALEQARVEVELPAKHLLVDRVLAAASNREVAKHEDVHCRELEIIRVRFGDAEREVLGTGIQQVEDDGDDHGRGHGSRNRARKHANSEQSRAYDLRSGSRVCPQVGWARQEPKELCDDVGRETINILDLVEPVVNHQQAGADAHKRDEEVCEGVEELRPH